jgi:hypothetical protein
MKTIPSVAKGFAAISAILGTAFLLTCGGGGGGGGGGAPPPSATVNTTTAPQIASAIGTIMTGVTTALAPMNIDTGSGIYSPKSLLMHARPLLAKKGRTLAGSASETTPCSYGGSVTLNGSWTGPDNPVDCSEMQDVRLEFIFAGCHETTATETLDGTMVMSIPGDSCAPSSFSVTLTNLRYQDPAAATDVTFNLSMNFTNIQYDQYDRIATTSVTLSGSIAGTSDGTALNVTYENFSLACSGIQYDINDYIVGIVAIINGRFYGTLEGDQLDEQFDDLTFTSAQTIQDSTAGMLVTISGRYRGACLDGWVTFATLTPIFIPDGSSCPTSGQVRISGNGQATITCNSDGSVDIDVDGSVLQYATCEDLPTCSVP